VNFEAERSISMCGSVPRKVELIWNKGIAERCDRRFPDEFASGYYSVVPTLAGALASRNHPGDLIADADFRRDIEEGQLVWVRLSWLKSFVKQVLPRVKSRFVLVTGDSDSCVPSEVMSEAWSILECRYLVHWYTQNYDGSMPGERISPLPIGIDFHVLSERPMWGESVTSPAQQEEILESIHRRLPPLALRAPEVYVDFAWQRGLGLRHYRRYHPLQGTSFRENRRRIAKIMCRKRSAFCQASPLRRTEMWQERGRYAFVLSPHGMGLDCHRTWEALALGHIVLVPSSSLDSLYANLPVITLNSWDEITAEHLEKWLSSFEGFEVRGDALTTAYWIHRMRVTARWDDLAAGSRG
jgi:hypothetical protein